MRRVRHEWAMAKRPPIYIAIYEDQACGFIPLSDGTHALVDIADIPLVEHDTWHTALGYAVRNRSKYHSHKARRMHRLIMGDPEALLIDHINGNKKDNRRRNLRLATKQQNCQNNHRLSRRNKSGKTGVSWDGEHNKWRAQIRVHSKANYLGLYATIVEAVEARRRAEKQYFGDFAPIQG